MLPPSPRAVGALRRLLADYLADHGSDLDARKAVAEVEHGLSRGSTPESALARAAMVFRNNLPVRAHVDHLIELWTSGGGGGGALPGALPDPPERELEPGLQPPQGHEPGDD